LVTRRGLLAVAGASHPEAHPEPTRLFLKAPRHPGARRVRRRAHLDVPGVQPGVPAPPPRHPEQRRGWGAVLPV